MSSENCCGNSSKPNARSFPAFIHLRLNQRGPNSKAPRSSENIPVGFASSLTTLILWAAGRHLDCHLPDSDPLRWVGRLAPRPLLIIHGGQDKDVPVSEAYRLYEAASDPKELWVVEEAGHRQVDQIYPDEYMSKVLAFFDNWL